MKKALHPKTDEPIRVIVTKLPENWLNQQADHIRLKQWRGSDHLPDWFTPLGVAAEINEDQIRGLAQSGAEWRYAEGSRRIEGIDPPDELRAAVEKFEPGPIRVIERYPEMPTLRDSFAMAALPALMAAFGGGIATKQNVEIWSAGAYGVADAMIAERDKRKT